MKDNTEKDNTGKNSASGTPQPEEDHILGKLTPGSFDTGLKQSPASTKDDTCQQPVPGLAGLQKKQHKGQTSPTHGAPKAQPPLVPVPSAGDDERLTLPKGTLVTMRKSGGLRFTSVQVTVYHNGSVKVEGSTGDAMSPPRRLRDKDLARLYRALGAAEASEQSGTIGHQSPDGYAYEIAADLGQTTYNVTTFDGSIPAHLSPLIQLLSQITNNRS